MPFRSLGRNPPGSEGLIYIPLQFWAPSLANLIKVQPNLAAHRISRSHRRIHLVPVTGADVCPFTLVRVTATEPRAFGSPEYVKERARLNVPPALRPGAV